MCHTRTLHSRKQRDSPRGGEHFGISKSTVHQDITARLEQVNKQLHDEVKSVLDKNKQERHLRGGQATKRKYAEISRKRMQHT